MGIDSNNIIMEMNVDPQEHLFTEFEAYRKNLEGLRSKIESLLWATTPPEWKVVVEACDCECCREPVFIIHVDLQGSIEAYDNGLPITEIHNLISMLSVFRHRNDLENWAANMITDAKEYLKGKEKA